MRSALYTVLAVASAAAVAGCESNSTNAPPARTEVTTRANAELAEFTTADPHIQDVLNSAVGYVVFPDIGEAAAGIGGASGRGIVYQDGKPVGTVKLEQVSVGPQLGGVTYGELIVFQNQQALNRLMNNSFEFGTQAEAAMVKAGAAAAARFDNGVGVYILSKGGLMAGVSLQGQKFHFEPNPNGNGIM
jgi:lipid-binding SYLF domain-containing protein